MSDDNPYAPPSGDNNWGSPPPPVPDPRFGPPATPQAPYQPAYQQAFPPPYQPAYQPQPYANQPYPNQYPPASYGYPAHTFRGNLGLGTALLVLGGVLVAGLVLRAASAPSAVHAYDAAWARGVDPRTVTTAHDVLGITFVVILPLWIVGALWISRAHSNAQALSPAHLRRSGVWCWLGWIVPIVVWWFPKQIVDDSWRITAAQLPPTSRGRYRATTPWWGFWIAFSILLGFQDRQGVYFTAETLPNRHLGVRPGLELLIALLGVVAYALWVPVVLGFSRAQEELARQYAPAPWR